MKEHEDTDFPYAKNGITRRQFMKYCGLIATALGLEASFIPKIAEALLPAGTRLPVVWLHFAECTGCSESFLRWSALATPGDEGSRLYIDHIILNAISVDYHETLMAPSGLIGVEGQKGATQNLLDAINTYNGEFICVCEGAIPTKHNGIYGMIGGKTMLQIAKDVCYKAKAVVCYGTCSSFGGLPAAAGNITGVKSVYEALGGFPTVNISGCPPNPFNLVATIVHKILNTDEPLVLDGRGRPTSFYEASYVPGGPTTAMYANTVHSQCPRAVYADQPPCLFSFGCRGKYTYNNCPTQKFNHGTKWPVEAGAPCYGCSEPNFWDDGNFYNYP